MLHIDGRVLGFWGYVMVGSEGVGGYVCNVLFFYALCR